MPAAPTKTKTAKAASDKVWSFNKQIVKAGEHYVGGKRRVFDEAKFQKWVDNFNEASKLGKRTPAPFKHFKSAVPTDSRAKKTKFDDGFDLGDASKNAGFWKKLWIEKQKDDEGNEVPVLMGEIHAKGDPEDLNTPAGKLKHTVEECSVFGVEKWKDGKGREWDDILLHIAPVVNAVEWDQPKFEIQGEVPYAIAMSTFIDPEEEEEEDTQVEEVVMSSDGPDLDNDGVPDKKEKLPAVDEDDEQDDISPLIALLEKMNVHVPKDTTPENFNHRLFVALNQATKSEAKKSLEDDDPNAGTTQRPPVGTAAKNRNPLAMSVKIDEKTQKFFSKQHETRKEAAKTRVQKLVAENFLEEEDGKDLNEQIDSFAMSLREDDEAGYVLDPMPVEKTLDLIEKRFVTAEREDEFGMSVQGRVRPMERQKQSGDGSSKLTPEQVKEKLSGWAKPSLTPSTARQVS